MFREKGGAKAVGGGAVAEWVRALAWTGDRSVLAVFESYCGKLRFGTLAISFTPLRQRLETAAQVGANPLNTYNTLYRNSSIRSA